MEEYESSSDDDSVPAASLTPAPAPDMDDARPWLLEFDQYLNGADEVPGSMSIPEWWGVSLYFFCISTWFLMIFSI